LNYAHLTFISKKKLIDKNKKTEDIRKADKIYIYISLYEHIVRNYKDNFFRTILVADHQEKKIISLLLFGFE
jgi:hypothetical protein